MKEVKRLSKGTRRHIRGQKAAIRRKFGNAPEGEVKIKDLILKHHGVKEPIITETKVESEKTETKKLHAKKSQPRSHKTIK